MLFAQPPRGDALRPARRVGCLGVLRDERAGIGAELAAASVNAIAQAAKQKQGAKNKSRSSCSNRRARR